MLTVVPGGCLFPCALVPVDPSALSVPPQRQPAVGTNRVASAGHCADGGSSPRSCRCGLPGLPCSLSLLHWDQDDPFAFSGESVPEGAWSFPAHTCRPCVRAGCVRGSLACCANRRCAARRDGRHGTGLRGECKGVSAHVCAHWVRSQATIASSSRGSASWSSAWQKAWMSRHRPPPPLPHTHTHTHTHTRTLAPRPLARRQRQGLSAPVRARRTRLGP